MAFTETIDNDTGRERASADCRGDVVQLTQIVLNNDQRALSIQHLYLVWDSMRTLRRYTELSAQAGRRKMDIQGD